ncbi:MAG: threonine/serine dehydratase [Acidobacteriota bacterium]|nr:threonine/serine dehydratase [Acidobacteriota bacterium]
MARPTPEDVARADRVLTGHVRRTPAVRSSWLSAVSGADVWLKLENQQIEGSFKARGAYYALLRTRPARAFTASAGNHGRALAFAARELGVSLTVFAPRTAPAAKLDPIRHHRAALELCDTYDEAEARARQAAASEGLPYISPYNHSDVIAGAGTAGLAALQDVPAADLVIVPVGGGGLISGVALAAQTGNQPPSVIGVEAAASPVFTTALAAGRLVHVEVGPTLADGLAGNAEPGSMTFELVRDLVADVVAVQEDGIAAAMRGLLTHEDQRVEGAGAVGVAALLAGIGGITGRRVVVMISGGNTDAP